MEKHVQKYLQTIKKKRFKTEDVEIYVRRKMKEEYETAGGYVAFATIMNRLHTEEAIKPVRSRGENGFAIALANVYQVLEKKPLITEEQKKQLLLSYHPKLSMAVYLEDYALFEKERPYIEAIHHYFTHRPTGDMSINERSFFLFRDEKFLADDEGKKVLKHLGITLDAFDCYDTCEPFFFYKTQKSIGKDALTIVIIENKDTFFTLKKLLLQGITTFCGIEIDLLIYGEGKKILHSMEFIHEIEEIKPCTWQTYYFGDIDPEGLFIYTKLKERNILPIEPFTPFYQALVQTYEHEEIIPRKKDQQRVKGAYEAFYEDVDEPLANAIRTIVDQGGYLPQEGLHKQRLQALANGRKNEHE